VIVHGPDSRSWRIWMAAQADVGRKEEERGRRGMHREAGRRGGESWDQWFESTGSGLVASGWVDVGRQVSGWSSSVRIRANRTPSVPRRIRRRIPWRSTGVLKLTSNPTSRPVSFKYVST